MSSIAGIGQLREQLNQYLQEILKIRLRDTTVDNTATSLVVETYNDAKLINATLKESNTTTH